MQGLIPGQATKIPHVTVLAVQSLSCVPLFATPWTAAHEASPSFTISRSLLKLRSIESVTPSNHLILCCPPSPPVLLNLSQHQGLFQWVSSSHQVAKVLEHQLKLRSIESVTPSNHLISCCPPSPPVLLNLSQHQGLFQWVSSSHQVAKVLEHQLGHYSFQWIFRVSRSTKNNFFNNIKNKSVHIDGRWGILEKQRPSKWVPCCVNKKENLGESILLYSV